MARYIDAEKLRKESRMLYSVHSFEPVEAYTQDQIDNAPTADVQEVINCLQTENAELKQRLSKAVELPCKVGDDVYIVKSDEVFKSTISYMYIGKFGLQRFYTAGEINQNFKSKYFGKTVFLTEVEAQAKLDEMNGGAE